MALDFEEQDQALALVDQLNPTLCRLKVGKELFVRAGPALIKRLVDQLLVEQRQIWGYGC